MLAPPLESNIWDYIMYSRVKVLGEACDVNLDIQVSCKNTAPRFIAALLLKVTSLNTCTRIEKQDVASQRPVGIMV